MHLRRRKQVLPNTTTTTGFTSSSPSSSASSPAYESPNAQFAHHNSGRRWECHTSLTSQQLKRTRESPTVAHKGRRRIPWAYPRTSASASAVQHSGASRNCAAMLTSKNHDQRSSPPASAVMLFQCSTDELANRQDGV